MDAGGKIVRIKEAVKANFNQSPDHYLAFEDHHGFFGQLNCVLISAMQVTEGADILDVGCGTGASSSQILEAVQRCKVWGLDNSAAMLATARSKFPESERLRFIEGDAGRLPDYFSFRFDAIIYSASIFLIPDYKESLRQAKSLLNSNGSLGVSFMDGVYNSDGHNLFALADKTAGLGVSLKKPVVLSEFKSHFAEIFPRHRIWDHDFRLSKTLLREFFSIPAMSAGLFPGFPFENRVKKVNILFDELPAEQPLFRWTIIVGERD